MTTEITGMERGAGTTQTSSSNTSRNGDWDPATADASTRKKLQKSLPPTNPANGARKLLLPFSNNESSNAGSKPNFTSRRRQSSIPNAKAPMGPRPLDISVGKRSISSSIVPTLLNTTNSMEIAASLEPHLGQHSVTNVSRFSFASIIPQDQVKSEDESRDPLDFADFLTPINFDDFHHTLTTDEPSLSHFPLPGRGTKASFGAIDDNTTLPQPISSTTNFKKISGTGSLARNNSLVRQQTAVSANLSRTSSKSEPMPVTTGSSVLRSRRQSQFPPNSFNNPNSTTKAPRKPIGPGTLVEPDPAENKPLRRNPSVNNRKSGNEQKAVGSQAVRVGNRGAEGNKGDDARISEKMRNNQTNLLHAPKADSGKGFLTPSRTPDHSRSSSINAPRTPGMNKSRGGTPKRTGTPSSNAIAEKRMSMMPPIATGLGARTISPTDARRMKRMSVAPPAPPLPPSHIPRTPLTPQPEPSSSRPRSAAQSPARHRKSVTPSSSRTTPDPNRKSYSSGQSLSSSTSYNSVRNSAALPPRLPNGASSSRLPNQKPSLEPLVVSQEDVPPVPAIPKAYESPQSELEQPFFSARSSGMAIRGTQASGSPTTFTEPVKSRETSRAPSSSSRKSVRTSHADTDPKQRIQPTPGKRSLPPLHLPPLNLLPLSTPTAAKIRAFRDDDFSFSDRSDTPPNRQATLKTPSTPLTASKASFFSKTQADNGDMHAPTMRSSTSHHALRARAPSSPSIGPPFSFEVESPGPRIISPFTSSSLPKNNGDFLSYMQPNFNHDLTRFSTQPRPSGPRAPSFSMAKVEKTVSPTESESLFSASSLRRKLSRKRSEPKPKDNADKEMNNAKYDNMPPPKLPASAMWTNFTSTDTSPTQRSTYLATRRKASGSSVKLGPLNDGQESISSFHSIGTEGRPSIESTRSTNTRSSQATSMIPPTQIASLRRSGSTNQSPHPDKRLDSDDLAAEEEMRKLASKRKDFESAARELDALRQRASPQSPLPPSYALHSNPLNLFERGEIVDYKEVYFTGTRKANKIVGDLNASATNFGYDDERGDYNIVNGDHLSYRYEVVDLLGKGSFGQVVRCIDHKTGILVAVKIIRNKKRFHQQALVEVNILKKLQEWDPENQHSVVNFDQSFYFRGHLCISTDLLGMNLYEFIKAHDFKGFSLKLIRRFTKQLLASLMLLHGHKVIHCDLKPENVLLAHPMHSEIKVIDFGSSCFENEKVYTYIQSRFYRSPEVILGMSYGMPIDMWSLGCILAELYTGYPIFPGENEQEQLACIMEIFGPPEKHLIEKSSRKKLFFDSMGKPRLSVSSKGRRRRPSSKDLRQALKCDDEAFLDFITRCLRWDPARRMNPHEASRHEFITKIKPSNIRKGPSVANSPIKRVNSIATPGVARPLPQPPATSFRNGLAVRQPEVVANSPSKGSSRRQSNVNAPTAASTAKRASHAAMASSSSSLSRVASGQRTISGRPDLAVAAATASLVR